MIGLSRALFSGRSGRRTSLVYGAYTGVQAGSALTLAAGTTRQALARVLRDEWDTPGTTLTLRVYRNPGRVLMAHGTVASGSTTKKGVAQPHPALPMMATPAFADGEFEMEIETSGSLRYAADVVE